MAVVQNEEKKYFSVSIERTNPQNIQSIFVNDMVVTHSNNEFFLTFSLIEPPIALDEKQAEDIKKVESVARVKLAVTPDFAQKIVKALEINIKGFEKDMEKK